MKNDHQPIPRRVSITSSHVNAVRICRIPYALLPLALLAAGCGSGSGSVTPSAATRASQVTTTKDGLQLTLSEDQTSISAGGTVTYTLTVTNTTTAPITYTPYGGCGITEAIPISESYLTVQGPAQTSVQLPPSPGGASCGAIGVGAPTTLAPGASLTGTVSLGASTNNEPGTYNPNQPGTYSTVGVLGFPGGTAANPASVSLTTPPLYVVVQ